ncbi:MAG: protein TolQ [Betaproteobacteria bacterium]|nr:protein TolQ [Betaproteobacteria bacterium]MDE2046980.1 protein TolQ [Betaproteobacteria bacterium]
MTTTDLNIVQLITQASFVVKLVVLLLLFGSLASWTVIFQKWLSLRRAYAKSEDFEQQFWSGTSLPDLYQSAMNAGRAASALQRIFGAGMREQGKLREKRLLDPGAVVDSARRAMRAAYQREMDAIESGLSFLASVGSVSPYVGLFGTVWGIMHAFVGLSNLQQVTLATVAPGIAEALVTTAIGLFAAIPAVVAYNFFARDIDGLSTRFESFMEEFLNILQRQTAPASPQTVVGSPGPSSRIMAGTPSRF